MHASRLHPAVFLLAAGLAGAAQAQPAATVSGNPADRCEASVAETVKRMRGKQVQDVRFDPGARQSPSATADDETGVSGEGRYRLAGGGSVPFDYSCAYNHRTGATSGVVFRETGPAPAATAASSADAAWQPDLSTFSPLSCEAATAALLKERHPRVGRITFAAETRRLQPAGRGTALEGRGTVERALGMSPGNFAFRCEFEPAGGRVLKVLVNE